MPATLIKNLAVSTVRGFFFDLGGALFFLGSDGGAMSSL
jgi:hypothetical protein